MKDWIDDIITNVYTYYNNREVVLWGKYFISDLIKDQLKEKYGIEVTFYIDLDTNKIDNKIVFSPDYLYGKSNQYYIVIPLKFHQSIKDTLYGGGYKKDIDYYYFADCIIDQRADYYKDSHGNKIIGIYQGLKFAFNGFNSTIIIGKNIHTKNCTFNVKNNTKIIINDDADLIESVIDCEENNIEVTIGECSSFIKSSVNIDNNSMIEIKDNCSIWNTHITVKKDVSIMINENVHISEGRWLICDGSKIEIGSKGRFYKGVLTASKESVLKIGQNFCIMWTYQIVLDDYTSVTIGNDCIISYDVKIRSGDGHSIFDLKTGKNINSTKKISQLRKIIIGDHVWIGMCSIVLYNTQIGSGSIIGADSLVKSVLPNNCIAAGIPAQVKKKDVAWAREYGTEDFQEKWDYRQIKGI